MPARCSEAFRGASSDHTETHCRSKTAIAPKRRQSIVVMASFARSAQPFPISPFGSGSTQPPDKPRLHRYYTQSLFQLRKHLISTEFGGFGSETASKLRFLA